MQELRQSFEKRRDSLKSLPWELRMKHQCWVSMLIKLLQGCFEQYVHPCTRSTRWTATLSLLWLLLRGNRAAQCAVLLPSYIDVHACKVMHCRIHLGMPGEMMCLRRGASPHDT
mmetsp:Transcript_11428/g.20865  ORF Transcript_11428/g.20865 Transcript_11428/m.20865 type:complete len:114 (+) Transcript_11428:45-386(+)